jgi:cytidylate kinase
MKFIVAIDGPAGTGKSSVARYLAGNFKFVYVDTGAIYRALAYLAAEHRVDSNNVDAIVSLIPSIMIYVDENAFRTRIKVDGRDVDNELRTENISILSSFVSQHKKVREALLTAQRELINKISDGAIFEGRDIGTVVFPHAPLKIFITANSETRARRRYEEIKNDNPHTSYDEVLEAIKNRDQRDKNRQNAPMQKALDAYVIDTSAMTLEEVSREASKLIQSAYKTFKAGKKLW